MGRKIFAALVALLFIYVASPLLFPVAMGAVLATLFIPWLEYLEGKRISTSWGSALLTLVITLFFVLPSSIVVFIGARAAVIQLQEIRIAQATQVPIAGNWIHTLIGTPKIQRLMEHITEWFPIEMQQLTETVSDLTRSAAGKLTELLADLVTHLPGMVIALAVIVVSVYFFLIDGRKLVLFLRRNSVFSSQQTDQLMAALAGTCRSVILASLVSGVAQASFETLVCLVMGIPNVALIGLLVFLGSFIPVVGSVPVTFAVALHQIFTDHNPTGLVMFGAALFVLVLDNFIRPIFLRGSANLHPLLAFVAAFGGLQTLGFSGVFLGPIIAAMFVVTIQILVKPDAPVKADRPLF